MRLKPFLLGVFWVVVAVLGLAAVVALIALMLVLMGITIATPIFAVVIGYRAASYALPPGPDVPFWIVCFLGYLLGYLTRGAPSTRAQRNTAHDDGARILYGDKPTTPRPGKK